MIPGQTGCPVCKGIEGAKSTQDPASPTYGFHGDDALVGAFFLGVCVERIARDKGATVAEMLCAPHLRRVRELSDISVASGFVSPENRHIVATGPHLRRV